MGKFIHQQQQCPPAPITETGQLLMAATNTKQDRIFLNASFEKIESNSYDEISALRSVDPALAEMIDKEADRQDEGIELIASENFVSQDVIVKIV